MIENDTWYKCTICGREGLVGRCCGNETRIPLNKLAKEEQERITSASTGQEKAPASDA
jgi:hypothetical protein